MMLLLVRMREFEVGGERIWMSSAAPLRSMTRGVSSNATRGCCVGEDVRRPDSSELCSPGLECSADISNASIKPGVMTIEHSSGWIISHAPVSDHGHISAAALLFWSADTMLEEGTLRYGP